jgi:hypothetical protein
MKQVPLGSLSHVQHVKKAPLSACGDGRGGVIYCRCIPTANASPANMPLLRVACVLMSWAPSRGLTLWLRRVRDGLSLLPTTKVAPAAFRDSVRDSTTREELGGGSRGLEPARVGLLGLQCTLQREGARGCSGQLRSK